MKLTDCYLTQRVTAKVGTPLYAKGCREGDVYYIGDHLINVEFDYLGTVAALSPDDVDPVSS